MSVVPSIIRYKPAPNESAESISIEILNNICLTDFPKTIPAMPATARISPVAIFAIALFFPSIIAMFALLYSDFPKRRRFLYGYRSDQRPPEKNPDAERGPSVFVQVSSPEGHRQRRRRSHRTDPWENSKAAASTSQFQNSL